MSTITANKIMRVTADDPIGGFFKSAKNRYKVKQMKTPLPPTACYTLNSVENALQSNVPSVIHVILNSIS